MQPAQVLLDQRHYDFLVEEAQRLDTSPDAVLKGLVEARMEEVAAASGAPDELTDTVPSEDADPFEELAGMVEGPGDAGGRDHDTFLYGRPRG